MAPERTDRTGGIWRRRSFVQLWAGQSAGSVSDQLLPIALSLYVVQRGGGVADVSLLLGGRAVALVLCLLIGGVLADRVPRIRLLITADVFRAAVLLAAVAALPHLALGALAVVTVLVTATGPRAALLVAAALFLIGAAVTAGVPGGEPVARRGASVLTDVADGFRAIRDRPWIYAVMGTVCLHLMAGTAVALTLLPVVAARDLGGAGVYGAAVAAMAAGALPAVVVAARYRPARPGRAAMLALVGYALPVLSLALPVGAAGVIAAFAAGGFVVEFFFVYWVAALQRNVPRELLGKVFALDQLGAYALLPVGYALVGPVVAGIGERPALIGGAVLVAVSSVLVLAVPRVAGFGDAPAA
ncbi:hypothetical protein [Actinoplanes octamycinicus]|nr:hypothetical protein [Actinoplanes octamycinicus]